MADCMTTASSPLLVPNSPPFKFLSLVKKRKLQWFGHITRAKGTLAHTTLQGKAEGGRMRGRPRRTWTSDLKEWTGHPLSHLTSLAENRPGWITLVDSLVAPTAGQTAMGPVSDRSVSAQAQSSDEGMHTVLASERSRTVTMIHEVRNSVRAMANFDED
ncbi:hypothetical protein Bbelb_130100 [Branchiostoma belcheri]|nr:hypothetical protein Bbelb_130100 [Branchiostoma belcheri]